MDDIKTAIIKEELDIEFVSKNELTTIKYVDGEYMADDDLNLLSIRGLGPFATKSFYLDDRFNWRLVNDGVGSLILLPLKKQ